MQYRHRERGSALIVAVVVVLILVGMAVAFIILSADQSEGTTDNVLRTQAFYVAEAGANAAIDEVRSGIDAGGDGLGVVAPTAHGGGTYSVTADLVAGAIVTPVGPATPVPGAGNNEIRLTATGTYQGVSRRVEVALSLDTLNLFDSGLFGDESLDVSGTVVTDSYDSSAGTYASQATNVDGDGNAYANEDGDIGSNGDIAVGGTSFIHGDSVAGPGDATTLGENAEVSGSTTPASQETPLPPVEYAPPPGPATPYRESGSGAAPPLGTGTYHYSTFDLGGSVTLDVTGDVVLYVDGDFTMGGTAAINIQPGATLTIYQGPGDHDFSAGGTGFVNADGLPTNLQVYSAAAGDVSIGGTADFYGAVYAPEADVTLLGTADTYGAFVGNTVKTVGTSSFHYDEALGGIGGGAPTYALISWQELVAP